MNDTAELAYLASCLRSNANAARILAHFSKRDAAEIHWLAHQVEEIAEAFQKVSGLDLNVIPMPSRRRSTR